MFSPLEILRGFQNTLPRTPSDPCDPLPEITIYCQIDQKGLTIRRGVIQDASFITSDPGHARADTPHGDQAKTRRSHDGT